MSPAACDPGSGSCPSARGAIHTEGSPFPPFQVFLRRARWSQVSALPPKIILLPRGTGVARG